MSSSNSSQTSIEPPFYMSAIFNTSIVWNLWTSLVGPLNLTIFPNSGFDTGANITVLEDNVIQLNFTDPGANFPLVLPIISQLIVPNAWRGVVVCTYPLSGQYDHLPRVLFYIACVVALLGRKLTWVAEAALGIVMSYAAVSAIHLFVLLGLYKFKRSLASLPDPNTSIEYGDIDFWGIAPVVTISVIVLTPMLSWSSTFRSHRAKIVLQAWALLMFSAFIPVFIYFNRWYSGNDAWTFDFMNTIAFCRNIADPSCSPEMVIDGLPVYYYRDQYDRCDCFDFCGLFQPTAPLRSSTGMVPVLYYRVVENLKLLTSHDGKDFERYLRTIVVCWVIAFIQGVIALLHSNSTPEAARNRIFRTINTNFRGMIGFFFKGIRRDKLLNRLHLQSPRGMATYRPRARRFVAKMIAASFYVFSLFSLVFYPILFTLNLVLMEILVSTLPTSESSSSLGAWSPWVATALIVLAALILAIHPYVNSGSRQIFLRLRYTKYDRPVGEEHDEKSRTAVGHVLANLNLHLQFKLRLLRWSTLRKRREFLAWWKDPEKLSVPEKREVDQEDISLAPECSCSKCSVETSTLMSRLPSQPGPVHIS
jgi:hypothetical protein